jgi:hypothetical protein
MVRSFDVSAEFNVDAATFLRDGVSTAYKAFQARRGRRATVAAAQRPRRNDVPFFARCSVCGLTRLRALCVRARSSRRWAASRR